MCDGGRWEGWRAYPVMQVVWRKWALWRDGPNMSKMIQGWVENSKKCLKWFTSLDSIAFGYFCLNCSPWMICAAWLHEVECNLESANHFCDSLCSWMLVQLRRTAIKMHNLPASFETIARCNVESHAYITIRHYWVNFDHLWLIDFRFTSNKNQTQKPSLNWSAFWPTTKSNPLFPRLVKPSDANWLIFKAWRNALRPSLCDWHLLCLRGRALLGERPWLMEWMV